MDYLLAAVVVHSQTFVLTVAAGTLDARQGKLEWQLCRLGA